MARLIECNKQCRARLRRARKGEGGARRVRGLATACQGMPNGTAVRQLGACSLTVTG